MTYMVEIFLKISLTSLGGFSRLATGLDGGARLPFYSPLKMLTRGFGDVADFAG